MKTHILPLSAMLVLFAFTVGPARASAPQDPLAGPATWKPPEWAELRGQVLAWLESTDADVETRESVAQHWPESEPVGIPDRLGYLIETFALADSHVASLTAALAGDGIPRIVPSSNWLTDGKQPKFVTDNCRLYLGRWAAQQQLYDEALEQLDGLTTDDVADPAGLLFYQTVVRQRLLQKKSALESLGRLLQAADYVPRRYLAVAQLMRPDLENLEDDSLDHIARRMDDIRRRLELGRANQKVQEIEGSVIESLDKLIEKAKQQQQQQAQGGAPRGGQPGEPAPDSRILPGRGSGEVTKKDIGEGSGWGDLPPKQREAALQQIGREFPAHYRDAIEQYFRRLAGSEADRK
jgi:hypothetical protein